jgi:hypothetical protein
MAELKEELWMSAEERDRLKILHEVKKRHITQKQAAAELGLSVRGVRALLVRWRARGDSALRHGLRGRASNRKTPEAVKQRAVKLYREKKQAKLWHDYGPTLAAEELAEDYGIAISRESLRQWLIEAHLWRVRRARVERAHVWRARRARYGELVQWDTSEHDWLEGRGEKLYLIGMIDDATFAIERALRGSRFDRGEPTAAASLYRAAWTASIGVHRQGQFISDRAAGHPSSRCSAGAAEPDWTRPEGAQHRMDRGPFAASQRAHERAFQPPRTDW